MGLDVYAFKRLSWVSFAEPLDKAHVIRMAPNPHFPKQAGTVREGYYSYTDSEEGPSLSYGAYNRWREQLAKLAGYNPSEAFAGLHDAEPFGQLVNFSDCEGIIGAEVSRKLERDFAAFDDRAKALDQWFYDKYVEFHLCFKCAADGGAVKFS